MARLALSLLGPVQLMLDGAPVTAFPYDKVLALLIYLAAESDRAHRRETLAELFWPDRDGRSSRHSLSQALWSLRQLIDADGGPPTLLLARTSVQFNRSDDCWLDLVAFTDLINTCEQHCRQEQVVCGACAQRLRRAVDFYRGSFLEDFSIGDSDVFDEWTNVKREGYQQRAIQALEHLIVYHERRGDIAEACAYARRQISFDPWREEAHRHLMHLLARSGQRSAALTQYERCRQILSDELGLDPEEETTALYAQIRDGSVGLGKSPSPSTALTPIRYELPIPPTPFVGRQEELARIAELLAEPGCRLITLVGPGGIGKTRLAIQTASEAAAGFADGACFIPLAGLRSSNLLVSTIADALGFSFSDPETPRKQLIGYLRDREILLLIDNFEHLLDEVALISELLERAPRVQVLVTSRERLSLRGEWVIDVGGLDVPEEDQIAKIEEFSAGRLFVQCALRAQSGWSLNPESNRAIARICCLVDGMPLGIELSAAWVPTLSCAEIAQEIQKSIDFLSVSVRDLPERHQSIRAVFDRTWEMLTENEQTVFRRLSVFRGGFRRNAAEYVAGASLPILSALVNKSLLRHGSRDRYDRHELLRQYAEDLLDALPEEAASIRRRHSDYYMDFLAQREESLRGQHQEAALDDVRDELANVRAAWLWASRQGRAKAIAKAVHGFWLFGETTGRYQELGAALEDALTTLDDASVASDRADPNHALALGRVLSHRGSLFRRIGDDERGSALIDRSIDVLGSLGVPGDVGLALNFRAMFAHAGQDYARERDYLVRSIDEFTAANDRWGLAYSLNDLGLATFLLGNDVDASQYCRRSLAIFGEIGDRRGTAFALRNLGVVACSLRDFELSRRFLQDSLTIRRSINHQWGVADSLNQLGLVAQSTGNLDEAMRCFREALKTALDIHAIAIALDVLVAMAGLLIQGERRDPAIAILSTILGHPVGGPEVRANAGSLLGEVGVDPPSDQSSEEAIRTIEDIGRALVRNGWAMTFETR